MTAPELEMLDFIDKEVPPEISSAYTRLYRHPVGYKALRGTESIVNEWPILVTSLHERMRQTLATAEAMVNQPIHSEASQGDQHAV